jgi:hypothetical protein
VAEPLVVQAGSALQQELLVAGNAALRPRS